MRLKVNTIRHLVLTCWTFDSGLVSFLRNLLNCTEVILVYSKLKRWIIATEREKNQAFATSGLWRNFATKFMWDKLPFNNHYLDYPERRILLLFRFKFTKHNDSINKSNASSMVKHENWSKNTCTSTSIVCMLLFRPFF